MIQLSSTMASFSTVTQKTNSDTTSEVQPRSVAPLSDSSAETHGCVSLLAESVPTTTFVLGFQEGFEVLRSTHRPSDERQSI